MDWKHWLFGFQGRINRAKFWLSLIPVFGLAIVMGLGVAVFLGTGIEWAIGLAAFAALVWISVAIGVKRLHDRDKSGWWLLLYYVVPGLLNGAAEGIDPTSLAAEEAELGNMGVALVLSLISFAISIWALIDLGILKGTQGPNRFGADPLGARQADASL